MTRFVPVTVLVLLALSRGARADDTMPTGPLASGTRIMFSDLRIHEDNNKDLAPPKATPDSSWHYFNLAHCQCTEPGAMTDPDFREKTFAYLLQRVGPGPVSRPLELWVGTSCNTDAARPPSTTATCHLVSTVPSVDDLIRETRPEIPIFDFMTPTPGAKVCLPAQQSSTLWALVDTNMNSLPDYSVSQQLTTDSAPPTAPSGFAAAGGDKGIQISWTPPTDTSDVYGFQALCARADTGEPGRPTARLTPHYMTARTLCGLKSIDLVPTDIAGGPAVTVDAGVTDSGATDAGATDAGVTDAAVTDGSVTDGGTTDAGTTAPPGTGFLPDELLNLNPMFLCGENLTATATSLRITGLENGVEYKVVLLELDKFQNAWGTFFTRTVTPAEATDFWEDINKDDKVDGGLCLLAETYGDDSSLTNRLRAFRDDTLYSSRAGRWLADAYYATLAKLGERVHDSMVLRIFVAIALGPVVAVALLWYWLTLPGLLGLIAALWWWRRRRASPERARRRLRWSRGVKLATAMTIVLGANHAHAGGYQPYWENSNIKPEDEHLVPNDPGLVRWHAGVRIGPYLPDVDSKLGSPGPFARNFNGARPMPMLDVDRILWTGFGQAGVGFSIGYMQWFAHTFIEPKTDSDPRVRSPADTNTFRLVPMALTATYRFTWLDDEYGIPVVPYVRAGLSYYLWWISVNGSIASVCKDPNAEMCSENKALGASLGLQGSIGLAVRAERIDAPTAMSMQQSGIQHAGIYAELSLAKVDGFGAATKLSVGDRTWFAGVDFEF